MDYNKIKAEEARARREVRKQLEYLRSLEGMGFTDNICNQIENNIVESKRKELRRNHGLKQNPGKPIGQSLDDFVKD